MNERNNKRTLPFAEEYWKEEGGRKWVEYLDATESSLGHINDILLEHARLREGEDVLDVGCGGGANSIEIAKRVGPMGEVTGVDISPPILMVARDRGRGYQNITFLEGDAAEIDLDQDYYDLVFSRFGVMFFSEPVPAFKNLRKSMKQSGRMVFLCWRTLEENSWMNLPTQAIFSVIPPSAPPPAADAPGPFSLASRARIEEILTAAGLDRVEIDAVDVKMKLGTLPEAVEYFMKMGPGAAALVDADDSKKEAVAGAITEALRQFESSGVVRAPGGAWIVSATALLP